MLKLMDMEELELRKQKYLKIQTKFIRIGMISGLKVSYQSERVILLGNRFLN